MYFLVKPKVLEVRLQKQGIVLSLFVILKNVIGSESKRSRRKLKDD